MIKIGINGFGRIGRAIFRINYENPLFEITTVNDIDPLIENHVYLANYDSIYGSLKNKLTVSDNKKNIINGDKSIAFYSKEYIDEIPWKKNGVDIVIDSTGIHDNVVKSRKLIKEGIKKVVITHSPSTSVDHTIIIGANENSYIASKHNIISSSICDANACAPVLKILNEEFSIIDGFITTMHPWLGYQNLLDGSLRSVSNPGHFWSDFALGRSSTDSLIPKPTSLVRALQKVLTISKNDIFAMSVRVPTNIVSASDMVLSFKKKISHKLINDVLSELECKYPDVVKLNRESLVSIDYKGIKQSCVIDLQWLEVINNKLKLVLWYDNEWGYSNRVIDLVKLISIK
tara:strand:- start:438 stop:1472 length:1035 start_codon:yes stop_codon:yes gene_type:complete